MDDSGVLMDERRDARATHRRWLWLAIGLVLVGGLLLAGRWWTAPDLFLDSGAGMRDSPRPVQRAALVVGVTAPDVEPENEPAELVFTDTASVEFAMNTAQSSAEVAVCRATSRESLIGSVRLGDLDKYCEEVVPVEDGVRMTQGRWNAEHREYLIVTLTPTQAGETRLTGVSVSYRTDRSHFYRRGTDSIDLDVLIRAR